ncbi:trace amine-associated receptor 3-like [Lissotriton helveticus]
MTSVDELCFPTKKNLTLKLTLYTLIFLLILLTLSGNFLVVISIAYFKQLRSSTNCFLLSLAVVDFLLGVMVMPYSMIRMIEGCWYFGPTLCWFHSSLDVMFCTASILHLSCIAFDRYYAVCNPLLYTYKMSAQRITALIVTSNLIDPFIGYRTGTVEWEVFYWLGYVNSAINPILYGFFHRSFRRAFLIVIGGNICKAGSTPNLDLSNEKGEGRTLSTMMYTLNMALET